MKPSVYISRSVQVFIMMIGKSIFDLYMHDSVCKYWTKSILNIEFLLLGIFKRLQQP